MRRLIGYLQDKGVSQRNAPFLRQPALFDEINDYKNWQVFRLVQQSTGARVEALWKAVCEPADLDTNHVPTVTDGTVAVETLWAIVSGALDTTTRLSVGLSQAFFYSRCTSLQWGKNCLVQRRRVVRNSTLDLSIGGVMYKRWGATPRDGAARTILREALGTLLDTCGNGSPLERHDIVSSLSITVQDHMRRWILAHESWVNQREAQDLRRQQIRSQPTYEVRDPVPIQRAVLQANPELETLADGAAGFGNFQMYAVDAGWRQGRSRGACELKANVDETLMAPPNTALGFGGLALALSQPLAGTIGGGAGATLLAVETELCDASDLPFWLALSGVDGGQLGVVPAALGAVVPHVVADGDWSDTCRLSNCVIAFIRIHVVVGYHELSPEEQDQIQLTHPPSVFGQVVYRVGDRVELAKHATEVDLLLGPGARGLWRLFETDLNRAQAAVRAFERVGGTSAKAVAAMHQGRGAPRTGSEARLPVDGAGGVAAESSRERRGHQGAAGKGAARSRKDGIDFVNETSMVHSDDQSSSTIPCQPKTTAGGASQGTAHGLNGSQDMISTVQTNLIPDLGMGNKDGQSTTDELLINVVRNSRGEQVRIIVLDGGSCGANGGVALGLPYMLVRLQHFCWVTIDWLVG